MKRIHVLAIVALLVLGSAMSASAVVINDPWPAGGGGAEADLYDIVQNPLFGSLPNFGSSQNFVNNYGTLQTLPGGSGRITAYAKYASFTQRPGIYQSQVPGNSALFPAPFPVGANGIFAVNLPYFAGVSQYGFLDELNNGQYRIYTEPNLNAGGLTNAVIIPITANHMIVAFEDGAGASLLGDKDYNDLVLNVTTCATPVPPTALLIGSGLLGLIGFRRFKKS